jgi:hypothetical protein
MSQDTTESDRIVAKTNPATVNGELLAANASLPVLRDSRIAVPNDVSCVSTTKNHNTKKHSNMDLNAYILAMAIAGVPRHQKNRQTVPEPEFKPFDLRYLRGLPACKHHSTRRIGRQGKAQNNVSETLPV